MAPIRTLLAFLPLALAAPTRQCLADPSCGPMPGLSTIYSDYTSIEAPWPGNTTGAVMNTTSGPAGPDDLLFQNLLSAEWIIFSFYQQGVEKLNKTAFIDAGYANDTYDRIREIRNNEAGHLRIFQNEISSNSIKPGPCQYHYPFDDPKSFLVLQLAIEYGSMAFLTGLERQAKTEKSHGALLAIAAVETRHNTWALMESWHASPFVGPSDTYFPYANQVLDFTNEWVVEGSCPSENPVYPTPRQGLPQLNVDDKQTKSIAPGSPLTLSISGGEHPLVFDAECQYYAVFFHSLLNITEPFHVVNMSTVVPAALEARGIYEVVIATEKGAPTKESVVAGPLVLMEQPTALAAILQK